MWQELDREDLAERFWRRVIVWDEDDCWVWTGGTTSGYGSMRILKTHVLAHRVSYFLHKGDIPEGAFILHSCDTPWCVNPDHLSPGTSAENSKDMTVKRRHARHRQTHCKHGHEFTPENTYLYRGRRECRACRYQRHHPGGVVV